MLAEETVHIAGCQQLDELVAADKVCMSGIDAQSQKICGITSKQIIKLLDLIFCRSFKQVLQTDLHPKLLTIGLQLIQRLACLLIEKLFGFRLFFKALCRQIHMQHDLLASQHMNQLHTVFNQLDARDTVRLQLRQVVFSAMRCLCISFYKSAAALRSMQSFFFQSKLVHPAADLLHFAAGVQIIPIPVKAPVNVRKASLCDLAELVFDFFQFPRLVCKICANSQFHVISLFPLCIYAAYPAALRDAISLYYDSG